MVTILHLTQWSILHELFLMQISIALSRDLAQQGVYPAIDVNQSVSRVMSDVVKSDHLTRAIEFGALVQIQRK